MNNICKYTFPLKILFDESHSESWSISEDVAKQMQPQNYKNSSYSAAADTLIATGFAVSAVRESGKLKDYLSDFDILIIVHPCDPDYESTVPIGTPIFSEIEVIAIHNFVIKGGGLIVISEYDHKKYGSNLNLILEKFGLKFENRTISEEGGPELTHPTWINPQVADPALCFGLTSGVSRLCFYRSTVCSFEENSRALVWPSSIRPDQSEGSIVCTKYGNGRILTVGDSDLFGDVYFQSFDHNRMWLNMVWWVGSNKLKINSTGAIGSDKTEALFASEIIHLVDELRQYQCKHVGGIAHDCIENAEIVIEKLIVKLQVYTDQNQTPSYLAHQTDYFRELAADFKSWLAVGLDIAPDFGKSFLKLNLQDKRGLHQTALIVAPMYLQNATTAYRFEAVYLDIPWPAWLKSLERDNPDPTYVPGRLLKYSIGYQSRCAVLFPEQVSSKQKLTDVFGVIFCDREAGRLVKYAELAASHFNITYPPDLIACLRSQVQIEDAFMLWDLMHNSSHFEGPLPYHRFKSGKKQPYWMYALEELRVDISAYSKIIANDRYNGVSCMARYIIVLDRLFRFSISGERSKNYDALAGQLLLAFIQVETLPHINNFPDTNTGPGVLRNGTAISLSWQKVEARILQLKELLDAHEKEGAALSLEDFWIRSYYLIAHFLPSALTSQFPRSYEALLAQPDKASLTSDGIRNRVISDEFPLSQMLVEYKKAVDAFLLTKLSDLI